MRSLHTAIATILLGATTIAVAYGAASTRPVGDVEAVQEHAYGTPPAAARETKHRGDGVVYQETLETLRKSGMLVKFNDGSKLTLGANSKVMVDSFVYAPGDAGSKALISIPAGALRYVTGAMPKGADFEAAALQLSIYRVAWADLAGVDPALVTAGFLYVRDSHVERPEKLLDRDELAVLLSGGPEGVQPSG